MRTDRLVKIVSGVLVALVPACLSYCQASKEADTARIEADAGYRTLVDNVRHLELVVQAQNDVLQLLLQNHPEVTPPDAPAGSGSAPPDAGVPEGGSAAGSAGEPIVEPALVIRSKHHHPHPKPVEDVSFPELPASNADALRMQDAKK